VRSTGGRDAEAEGNQNGIDGPTLTVFSFNSKDR